ncbi:hypothetical protein D0B54_10130 [Solimonas sp. K1W22B-7]|uniref:hypothetical protein n=1 Tax=Solimonas sp. K1W22B-7 TaxID=2303331 RepID=UPI000E3373B6|nr:hypothetical protein [Solimonas sp. K1W22B-7]AXQ29023.1 hypothetical protein D0B54_10130 [Solimonas sp. K1W22B-7]
MAFDSARIASRIEMLALQQAQLDAATAHGVAFHMTDWLEDLDAWHRFCINPDAPSQEELSRLLMGFLLHVPEHLAAAAKLFTGLPITDTFGVNATSASCDPVDPGVSATP